GPRSTGRPRIVDLADALLAQFERRLPAFFVWQRSSTVVAIDFWSRACAVTRRFGCLLSVGHHRRPNVPQLSMGHLANRDRFFFDFSRTVAALAQEQNRSAGFARRTLPAQTAALQTDAHVGRGEAH